MKVMILMGDVTEVMTVWELEGKKVDLQKHSSSNIMNQCWTIHFE